MTVTARARRKWRWPGCSRKKPWIVPLFGTRKLERFDENIGALNVTLSTEDIAELERGSAEIGVTGQRYPAEAMRQVGL